MASTWALLAARDYEHALEFVDELPARFPWLEEPPGMERGTILSLSGRPEEAVAVAERVVEKGGSILDLAFLAWTQALAGRREAARKTLARQETISATGYSCPYETALAWAALEEYAKAEELFEQGIEERAICWVARNTDPRTDPLREFDWFQALVARVTPMGPDDPDFVPVPEELGLGTGR